MPQMSLPQSRNGKVGRDTAQPLVDLLQDSHPCSIPGRVRGFGLSAGSFAREAILSCDVYTSYYRSIKTAFFLKSCQNPFPCNLTPLFLLEQH